MCNVSNKRYCLTKGERRLIAANIKHRKYQITCVQGSGFVRTRFVAFPQLIKQNITLFCYQSNFVSVHATTKLIIEIEEI